MRYFRNIDIVNEFGVNEATVRKWIRDAKAEKLGLVLFAQNNRTYIADTDENKAFIKKLIETRRKFRNTKAEAGADIRNTFLGIWRSDYSYNNSELNADEVSQQYVRIYRKSGELIVESIPDPEGSYMYARFSIDGNIVTGSWQQVTSPRGDYKGIIYHGAAQLLLTDNGTKLSGKWVGFGKKMEIKTGPWKFVYIGEDESALADQPELVTQ
jgi:hypothetical protein